jgi:hypothetical protein
MRMKVNAPWRRDKCIPATPTGDRGTATFSTRARDSGPSKRSDMFVSKKISLLIMLIAPA